MKGMWLTAGQAGLNKAALLHILHLTVDSVKSGTVSHSRGLPGPGTSVDP